MKECDERKSQVSSEINMTYISSNNDSTLLLRPTLHFSTLYTVHCEGETLVLGSLNAMC